MVDAPPPPGTTGPEPVLTIQRRTGIDSGDYENALMRIINLLADWEEHPPWSNKPMPVQAPSTATTIEALVADFNALLLKMQDGGMMERAEP